MQPAPDCRLGAHTHADKVLCSRCCLFVPSGEEQVEAQNEAGQRSGGNSGPDSWQFWAPNRQLLADPKPEAGQHTNFGPDGYQAWAKNNEAGQKTQGGASGPDSWQFWAPNRQLLGTGRLGRCKPICWR